MSGTKRKQPSGVVLPNGDLKKQKRLPDPVPEHVAPDSDQEFETDSDPIIESDTTEHSGDDDGASWPSDDNSDALPEEPPKLSDETFVKSKKIKVPGAPTNDTINQSSSSKEAHAKQKALAQERKAAKPNADSIARTKKLWERLRRKSHVPLEERKKLVAELFA
ncbi:MAG: hypothetical protein Q9216_004313 [Gyalolechia sp. 2 TL-2023]